MLNISIKNDVRLYSSTFLTQRMMTHQCFVSSSNLGDLTLKRCKQTQHRLSTWRRPKKIWSEGVRVPQLCLELVLIRVMVTDWHTEWGVNSMKGTRGKSRAVGDSVSWKQGNRGWLSLWLITYWKWGTLDGNEKLI